MKALITSLLFSFCLFAVQAQTDCRPFVPTEVGTKWEITNYNKKGKELGKISYELIEKEESGNDITFTIKNVTYDKKGEEVYSNTYDAKCVDGKFEFDMTYKMDGSALQAYQDMDVEIDASKFELPSLDEALGTKLEDGSLSVGVDAGGALRLNMTVDITNRKVEAKEQISTPAGSFDCVILSQDISTKFLIKVQASSKEWYAENVGMVRSESYNKSGKLTGYSELTMIEKN